MKIIICQYCNSKINILDDFDKSKSIHFGDCNSYFKLSETQFVKCAKCGHDKFKKNDRYKSSGFTDVKPICMNCGFVDVIIPILLHKEKAIIPQLNKKEENIIPKVNGENNGNAAAIEKSIKRNKAKFSRDMEHGTASISMVSDDDIKTTEIESKEDIQFYEKI